MNDVCRLMVFDEYSSVSAYVRMPRLVSNWKSKMIIWRDYGKLKYIDANQIEFIPYA